MEEGAPWGRAESDSHIVMPSLPIPVHQRPGPLDPQSQTLENIKLGDICIKKFHLGRYIVGYNFININL